MQLGILLLVIPEVLLCQTSLVQLVTLIFFVLM